MPVAMSFRPKNKSLAARMLLLGLGMAGSAAAQQPQLRMGYTASWAMPWGHQRNGNVIAGINHDIGQALAHRVGMQLRFSRVRQLRAGEIEPEDHAGAHSDFGCGMHPSWFPHPERYHWSVPLFEVGDVLVGRRGSSAPARLEALPAGTAVGTVRTYHYPTLQARFAKGELRREDSPDQAALLRKLAAGRMAVAVISPQALDWNLRRQPSLSIAPWRLKVQSASYHCAVPKTGRVDARMLLDALQALEREGEIARILARYAPA